MFNVSRRNRDYQIPFIIRKVTHKIWDHCERLIENVAVRHEYVHFHF